MSLLMEETRVCALAVAKQGVALARELGFEFPVTLNAPVKSADRGNSVRAEAARQCCVLLMCAVDLEVIHFSSQLEKLRARVADAYGLPDYGG